jgi:hypothetical protein
LRQDEKTIDNEMKNQFTKTNKKFLTSKAVFTVTMIVAVLTVLSIWLFGLGQHRTVFENSILSTTILSIVFFLFIAIGLYNGMKLKDDIGNLTDKIKISSLPDFSRAGEEADFLEVGDGIGGIIISIVLWILMTFLIGLFLWLFGAVLWSGVIVFIAMLYWIFFRALRLVFKNSNKCKGNLATSLGYGLFYTVLYTFWVYGIIFISHYLL